MRQTLRLFLRLPQCVPPRCWRAALPLALGLAAGMWARAAVAQFGQYAAPGGPEGRPVSKKEALEKAMEKARFHLGPVRLAPTFGLRDVTYVNNVFAAETGAVSDLTATVGGGARGYLRTGSRLIWSAQVLPEYVWWRRLTTRRRLDQRFGADLLGSFNRLEVQVAAARDELQAVVTPELLVPVNTRGDHAGATAELRLFSRLAAFATGAVDRYTSLVGRGDPDAAAIAQLDREERVARGGLRYHTVAGWTLGLGGEHSQVDFLKTAINRSNSGTAPVLELRFDRPRFFASADVAARSLDAARGASFVRFHQTTGHFDLGLNAGGRVEGRLYGGRNLVYSLLEQYSYLTDERIGAAVSWKLGWRTSARLFAEDGRDRYTAFLPATPHRRDAVSSLGGALHMDLRSFGATLQATHTRLSSNLPGAGRSYQSVSAGLTFGAGE